MARITLDGRDCEVADGLTVLQAAESVGIEIPALCSDPRLAPSGACRICVVAVDDRPRPEAACTTPVRDGMVIDTSAPEIERLRRTLLELLARDYRTGAVAASPHEPFHRLLLRYGLEHAPRGPADASLVDVSHPLIQVDLSRCISCWRCVRICDEVQGQFVWRIDGRGAQVRVAWDSNGAFADSSCVACGACVDTCPTGALEDSQLVGAALPTTWTRTTCPYCGVGCEMDVGSRDGSIVTVVPALEAPVNQGHLCVKGRYAHGFTAAPDRCTQPMLRDGSEWRAVSWDEVIAAAATALRRARDTYGAEAVGVLGSARATNEDNYLVQKLARVGLGTNNVDCCARVCHAPSAVGLSTMLGTGAATSSFDDIEIARTILVCGSNTTENHPIVGARIKQAVRRGARLIVIDPRRIELSEHADVHLRPRPGTTVALLNGLAAAIIEAGLVDHGFVAARVKGFDAFAELVTEYTPERAAALCGVAPDDIRAAARLYASTKPAISFHGLGVTEHEQGTDGVMCLVNLALLTGNLGHPGAGVNPLRGQNNVQGAAHMGCEPAHLPGYAPLADARDRVGAVWGAEVPESPGLDAMEMLDAAGAGGLHALYVVGWDLLLTQPDANTTRRALANIDTLIVQDLFLNETARELATIFLPAASAFEKDGTFMNSERRVQRVRSAIAPPGDALPDWEIVARLGAALGRPELFRYDSPAQIWEEIRRVWLPGAGIGYERLDAPGGLQWPCPTDDHPGTALLHRDTFGATVGERATLRTVAYSPTTEQPTPEYPFVLITGRTLTQFNAGTMTSRSATHRLRPTDLLELATDDASQLGLADGDMVRVRSRYGEAELPVEVTDRVVAGTVFATFHDPARAVNRVTGSHRDAHTNTPEYKVTAVRIERIEHVSNVASVSAEPAGDFPATRTTA
ncbi:MAG: formate dehydrogenase subunit alpha [Acidimicrobiia bacterium]